MGWKKAPLVLHDRCRGHKIKADTSACVTLLPTENNTTNEEQLFFTGSPHLLRRRLRSSSLRSAAVAAAGTLSTGETQLLRLENMSVSVVCLLPLVDDEETAERFGVFTVSLVEEEEEVGVFEDFAVSLEAEAGVFGVEDGACDLPGVTELRVSTFPLLF